jgi:TonB family protein
MAPEERSEGAPATSKHSTPGASLKTAASSAALPSQGAAIVPPKLIKSVRAIASPNALEYFAHDKTATVTVDAVVDATGRVKSMKVLSGPASLRDSAVEALKQYRYEPATLHGKPVDAHVTVPIKFLFEP